MDGATAVAEVRQGLAWRGTDKDAEILSALNYVQDLREQGESLPWFLVAEDQSLTLTANSQAVTLPTRFLAEREEREGNLRYRSSVSGSRTFFLKKMDYLAAEKYFFGDWQNNFDLDATTTSDALSPGIPRAYVLRSTTLRIYPVPDQAYVLTWDYYKAADDIVANTSTNSWLTYAPWVIIGAAGWKLAQDLQNSVATDKFLKVKDSAEKALMEQIVRRGLDGRPIRMGSRL